VAGPAVEADRAGGIELSIVMPCLNESETLETCIRKAQGFLQRSGIRGEIVIGDNGSIDGSQEIARRNGARVIDVPLRGYGAALYFATLGARGKYVIMGDSDDSYDFTDLMPFVQKLREGNDLVMGNRFLGGIKPGAMPWKNRYIGNPILSGIGRLTFRCPAKDFHCGLRGYSLEAFRRMDLRTTGMEFASEMVIKATLMGMRISEVPTTLSPDGRSRAPHLRPWRDGWRHLRFMLLYSPRWLFIYPGAVSILVGMLVGGWLLPAPRWVGSVRLDIHTLLYAGIAVVLGFQSVLFGFFAKAFAMNEGLLPPDKKLEKLFKIITLEVGLVIGFALLAAGVAGSAASVLYWRHRDFGMLDASRMFRFVIPSALALTLGVQMIFGSFFLSVLGLRVRRYPPTSEVAEAVAAAAKGEKAG
jgi:glycosyltransferase involved in cell wall biosynthesis